MHILVAEDDNVSRELLRRMLESSPGISLELTGDGEQAWQLLSDSSRHFDACVMDIQMPGLDGLELVTRIRGEPRLAQLPVILCTAANDRATVERAAGLSVSGYIVKPYTRERVLERIQRIGAGQAGPLGNTAEVCRRLGIDLETHRALLQATLADIREWIGRLRSGPSPAELEKLLVRASGLKGACLSLGASIAAQRLGRIQSALDQGALDGLEHEIARIGGTLGVPAAA